MLSVANGQSEPLYKYGLWAIFPKADLNSNLSQFLLYYGLDAQGVELEDTKTGVSVATEISKAVYGGIPIPGILYLYRTKLRFEPDWVSVHLGNGISAFEISYKRLTEVSAGTLLGFKTVLIKTRLGELNFGAQKKHWYSVFETEAGDIISNIQKLRYQAAKHIHRKKHKYRL